MENEKNNKNHKKIFTKERIILFTIGLLTGAVIATAAFFIYVNVAGVGTGNSNQSAQMPDGTPPEMPEGETPPEMPEGETPDDEATDNETINDENDTTSRTSDNSENSTSQSNNNNKSQPPAKPSEKKTKKNAEE